LSPQEEHQFLTSYLKCEPNPFEKSKLLLMKQVSYCYHILHFLDHAYHEHVLSYQGDIPRLSEWLQARKNGHYAFNTANDLMRYAMVLMNESLRDIASPEFSQAKNAINRK
jgi:hypothetical protein